MAQHRFLADAWIRLDPETVNTVAPKFARISKGDICPPLTDEEIHYLTNGPRKQIVEADSDEDPYKDRDDVPRPKAEQFVAKVDKSAKQ